MRLLSEEDVKKVMDGVRKYYNNQTFSFRGNPKGSMKIKAKLSAVRFVMDKFKKEFDNKKGS